jgi:23S rRNA (uracil1939-C5)-methyltransferase
VTPPPGACLRASADGERAIVDAVLDGLPEPRAGRLRISELYAGCGTITFALAERGRVAAFEGDAAAVAALRRTVNQTGLAGRITAEQRDLARQPLTAKELSGVSAVVLDPPHAGAAAQMPAIAAAKPARVIYVSCNPAVLARDAYSLREAGYNVLVATPVDQFLWSARMEGVVVFSR